jgi:hypothetical protein
MHVSRGPWHLSVDLDRHTNPLRLALSHDPGDGLQTIAEWIPGPFDPLEELISIAVEMIEQYEWKGVQLPLPGSPG